MATKEFGLLRSAFTFLVESNDRPKDGSVELLKFILFVLDTVDVSLRNIQMTLRISKFLYPENE